MIEWKYILLINLYLVLDYSISSTSSRNIVVFGNVLGMTRPQHHQVFAPYSQRSFPTSSSVKHRCGHILGADQQAIDLDKLLLNIPLRNRDPRLFGQCRSVFGEFHGVFNNEHHPISVSTIEDVTAELNHQPSPRSQACGMLHPYGRFVSTVSSYNGTGGILYVEVPKCASTTIKSMLSICIHPELDGGGWHSRYTKNPPIFQSHQLSFTIVRDPLQRFVSGYQTIRTRLMNREDLQLVVHQLGYEEREVNRFIAFTNRITKYGAWAHHQKSDNHNKESNNNNETDTVGTGCTWYHTLSQMWFIEMYPQQINFVLHLETLEQDLELMKKTLPIKLPSTTLPKTNQNGGDMTRIYEKGVLDLNTFKKKAPLTVLSIIHYLRQDYACLNYSMPNDIVVSKIDSSSSSSSSSGASSDGDIDGNEGDVKQTTEGDDEHGTKQVQRLKQKFKSLLTDDFQLEFE